MWYWIVAAICPFVFTGIVAYWFARYYRGEDWQDKSLLDILDKEQIEPGMIGALFLIILVASAIWIVTVPLLLVIWLFVAVFNSTRRPKPEQVDNDPLAEDEDEEEDENDLLEDEDDLDEFFDDEEEEDDEYDEAYWNSAR